MRMLQYERDLLEHQLRAVADDCEALRAQARAQIQSQNQTQPALSEAPSKNEQIYVQGSPKPLVRMDRATSVQLPCPQLADSTISGSVPGSTPLVYRAPSQGGGTSWIERAMAPSPQRSVDPALPDAVLLATLDLGSREFQRSRGSLSGWSQETQTLPSLMQRQQPLDRSKSSLPLGSERSGIRLPPPSRAPSHGGEGQVAGAAVIGGRKPLVDADFVGRPLGHPAAPLYLGFDVGNIPRTLVQQGGRDDAGLDGLVGGGFDPHGLLPSPQTHPSHSAHSAGLLARELRKRQQGGVNRYASLPGGLDPAAALAAGGGSAAHPLPSTPWMRSPFEGPFEGPAALSSGGGANRGPSQDAAAEVSSRDADAEGPAGAQEVAEAPDSSQQTMAPILEATTCGGPTALRLPAQLSGGGGGQSSSGKGAHPPLSPSRAASSLLGQSPPYASLFPPTFALASSRIPPSRRDSSFRPPSPGSDQAPSGGESFPGSRGGGGIPSASCPGSPCPLLAEEAASSGVGPSEPGPLESASGRRGRSSSLVANAPRHYAADQLQRLQEAAVVLQVRWPNILSICGLSHPPHLWPMS